MLRYLPFNWSLSFRYNFHHAPVTIEITSKIIKSSYSYIPTETTSIMVQNRRLCFFHGSTSYILSLGCVLNNIYFYQVYNNFVLVEKQFPGKGNRLKNDQPVCFRRKMFANHVQQVYVLIYTIKKLVFAVGRIRNCFFYRNVPILHNLHNPMLFL